MQKKGRPIILNLLYYDSVRMLPYQHEYCFAFCLLSCIFVLMVHKKHKISVCANCGINPDMIIINRWTVGYAAFGARRFQT